ncbi:MAG: hypothetical protein KC731_42695, partial [Myxococcales bacterium]|nr:hypothetical protein [Myxococcales bacterium]
MTVTLTGPDPQRLALATVEALCPPGPPLRLDVCGDACSVSPSWLRDALAADAFEFSATWSPHLEDDPDVEDLVYSCLRGSSLVIRASLFDDLMAL